MSVEHQAAEPAPESGVSRRGVEVTVAVLLIGLAVAVLWDSYKRGAGWVDGPQTGFFPARVGWLFLAGSVFLLYQAFREPPQAFASWRQLAMVAKVAGPLLVFCALIEPLGIYVAAAIFSLIFMPLVGGARFITVVLTSTLVPLVAFWVFERQFLVPLPKGPVEALFGF